MNRLYVHAIPIWVAAPGLLWLTLYRPFTESSGRAERVPERIGRFEQVADYPMSDEYYRQLGTDDAVWRRYRSPGGGEVFLVAVFHQANWKSLHPPHICLRGTNMDITGDRILEVEYEGRPITVGRIRTFSRDKGRPYVSVYAYVAPGLITGSYASFFLHHAPRALVRQSVGGCLLRVESWIPDAPDGAEIAERRCRAFLAGLLPVVESLL